MEAPILAYPDLAKEYILDTDSSDHSAGAVLSQVQGGSKVVVAYYSKLSGPPKRTTTLLERSS